MRNLFLKTRLLITIITLFAFSVALTSCKDDDEGSNANEIKYENVVVTGAQEVPAVPTTATGMFSGTYNKTTKILTYSVTHNVSSPTMAHFHKAALGVNGGVEVPITSLASPISGSTPALTTSQEADLLNGLWYVNIHSTTYGGGEIRGQLPKKN